MGAVGTTELSPRRHPRAGSRHRDGTGPAGPVRKGRRRPILRTMPYLLLLPSLVVLVGLMGYPLVRLVVLSFQHYGRREFLIRQGASWVGLDNYRTLFADSQFWSITIRTVVLTVVIVALTVLIALLVALMMQRLDRVTRTVVSLGLMISWATPAVSSATIFKWMLDSRSGIIPKILGQLHLVDLTGDNSVFLSGFKTLAAVTAMVVWQSVPFVALTLFAGLTQISADLYEAARVDGAGPWRSFTSITMPMLRPIFALVIVLSVIWDLRLFTQVYTFNNGGPDQSSYVLGVYSYFTSIVGLRFGQGAAIAIVLIVMALIGTAYYIRRLVRSGEATA